MALISGLFLLLGPAIAKAMIKAWLGEGMLSDVLADLTGELKSRAEKVNASSDVSRVEQISAQVVTQLQPFFESEFASLADEDRASALAEVAETLAHSEISTDLLLSCRLNPQRVTQALIAARPKATTGFSSSQRTLYERTLFEISRAIVDSAGELLSFTSRATALGLEDNEKLLSLVERLYKLSDKAAERFAERYRDEVARVLNRMELFGIPRMDDLTRSQKLTIAYITLQVEQQSEQLIQSEVDLRGTLLTNLSTEAEKAEIGQPPPSNPVDVVLARSRRLVVRGDAGSGKSTLLQWVAVRATHREGDFPEHMASWRKTMPFYIRLRECVDSGFPKPEEFPSLIARNVAGSMPLGWVHEQLENGRAVVLVDGVDEVPRDQRTEMLYRLGELVETYKFPRYIITSRPSALKEWQEWADWVKQAGFVEVVLQPMSSPHIAQFVKQWHDALTVALDPEERDELPMMPGNLLRLLEERPPLRRLAANPLLCAMICSLHRERRQRLPVERLKLYEECVEMLNERREKTRLIRHDPIYPDLNSTQKLTIISNFALWMMRNQDQMHAVETARQVVETAQADAFFQRQLPNMGLANAASGESVRRFFVERASLLREPTQDQIEFAHSTFQEYLAAQAILAEDSIGELLKHADDPAWREIIILAAGLARPKERRRLLEGLIRQSMRAKKRLYTMSLLAVACLETCAVIEPDLKQSVLSQAKGLFPPRNDESVTLAAAAGDLAVSMLKYRSNLTEIEAANSIRSLALIGSDAALAALAKYASDERFQVVRALGIAWNSFERVKYVQQVLVNSSQLMIDVLGSWTGFDQLTHLKALQIRDLSEVKDLNPIAQLTNLEELALGVRFDIHMPLLVEDYSFGLQPTQRLDNFNLRPLSQLQKLRKLAIPTQPDLSPIENLPQLTYLELSGRGVGRSYPLYRWDLREMLQRYEEVELIQPYDGERQFGLVDSITHIGLVDSITHIPALANLQILIVKSTKIGDCGTLMMMPNLTRLEFVDVMIDDPKPLGNLLWLQTLRLVGVDLTDLSLLAGMSNLIDLEIIDYNIRPGFNLFSPHLLQTKSRSYRQSFKNVAPLAGLTNLSRLHLTSSELSDISELAKLIELSELAIGTANASQAIDLSSIAGLKRLTTLVLRGPGFKTLEPIGQLVNLRSLTIESPAPETSLQPIAGLTALEKLTIPDYLDDSPLKDREHLTIQRAPSQLFYGRIATIQ